MDPVLALKTALSLLVPLSLGYFALGLLTAFDNFWARLSLATGIGFGLSSLLFFGWILLIGRATPGFMLIQGAAAVALAVSARWLTAQPRSAGSTERRPFQKKLQWAFFLVLLLSLATSILHLLYNPQGDWDAWDLWNMRALFLVKAGNRWPEFFSPEMPRAMDYPLMLSGAIAAAWKFVGVTKFWVPGSIAILFTLSTVGLLVSAVQAIRGGSQGWLAGIVLASTPFFARHGASQYADIEFAYYVLGSVGFWVWSDYEISPSSAKIVISGMLAGLAAWTKNEGMLFLIIALLARILCWARPGNFRAVARELGIWLFAALPALVALFYFKEAIAPPNDLFSNQIAGEFAGKLTSIERYLTIGKSWAENLTRFGHWRFGIPLALLLYAAALGRCSATRKLRQFPCLVLVLLVLVYSLIYVLTPYPLGWHLSTSLDRLLFQLWPLAIFTYFLTLHSPEEFMSQGAE